MPAIHITVIIVILVTLYSFNKNVLGALRSLQFVTHTGRDKNRFMYANHSLFLYYYLLIIVLFSV